jgi:hypothetical protein
MQVEQMLLVVQVLIDFIVCNRVLCMKKGKGINATKILVPTEK